ncbi:MAG: polymer-forming cytoskeletal protein [Bacteroidia bacterium]|nr:polymer-forming cytoskeletal protein [Bacteroidia bacterium]
MFNKNQHKGIDSVNLLGKGTVVNGDVHIQGDFRLDGKLEGNLKVSGRLVVGPEGVIFGNVESEFADISGEIKGDMKIRQILHMKNGCKIEGDLDCDKLVVDSGAIFNGTCRMGAKLKNLQEAFTDDKKFHEAR